MRENVALQNELDIPSRIVAPAEAAELVPGLDSASVVGGAWCAEDGYFDRPQSLVEALGAQADVQIADVLGVEDEGVVRLATGGELHADAVVIAAGVDTPRLLPELPIRPEGRYLFFSDPMRERLLEPLVVSPEHRFAAKQLGDGRLLASDLGAVGDPAVDARSVACECATGVRGLAAAARLRAAPGTRRGDVRRHAGPSGDPRACA